MFLSEWCEFPLAPCLAGKKNLMTAHILMLLKSCALPDMLPFSLCNKKRLAIRHIHRPLFPVTLSILSYDIQKQIGLRTYQHPHIHFSVSFLFLTTAFNDGATPNLAASEKTFCTGIHMGENVCFFFSRESFPLLWFTHCDDRSQPEMKIKLFASLIRSKHNDLIRVQHLLFLITRLNQEIKNTADSPHSRLIKQS